MAGCTTDGPTDGNGGGGSSPTDSPTDTPTDAPTDSPTESATDTPTDDHTASPPESATDAPTDDHTASPTDSGEHTDEGTATRTRTPQGNGIVSEEFEVTNQSCGTGKNAVDITFDGQAVALDGVIDGSDACYTAEQESVDYDPATDRMRVNVRAYRPDEDAMCADCVVDIEYEARYVFEGGTPEEVTVAHDGRDVASARQGSSSSGTY
jgi:hypothetical protein